MFLASKYVYLDSVMLMSPGRCLGAEDGLGEEEEKGSGIWISVSVFWERERERALGPNIAGERNTHP